ncbi:ATP-binding protein [Agromyces sp. NPDC056965]|uniref:ATP-binding protein n=1 Tax=Agromyces sp. NPDC056965 TaxID=3345983 RepID=UPI00363BAF81
MPPTTTDAPRVALLGPVLVAGRSGELVEPPGTLAKALIALLAEAADQPGRRGLSTNAIAAELWGEAQPRNPRAALQTLVSRARGATVEGLIVSTTSGYALAADERPSDLALARSLLADARSLLDHEPGEALAAVEDALALWRGEPGADLGDAPIGAELAGSAAAINDELHEVRARARLATGDPGGAADDAGRLATTHPLNERRQLLLLQAMADDGRRQEALEAFGRFRARLRDELGASPGAELVALNTRLLDDEPGIEHRVRLGLRAEPNELLGREHDVAAISALLGSARLVTVLGPGGLGKTRLAQAVAARADDPAVVVVELASIRSDDDVTLALASTLGIGEPSVSTRLSDAAPRPDLATRVVQQLAERPTLLVLDNCEHVIDGAARWTATLLASAPHLRVLATSRSPLAITAEHVYPLGALPTVNADGVPGAAVQLFRDRANSARPGVSLPREAVERLCTHLDGLPLAIELAAARVRSMSVEQIEARLEHRFALLVSGDRSAPERHRTLQAVIEWSWRLLEPAEQRALARLSLFVDGFGVDAAARMIGDDGDAATAETADHVVDALVAQSLLAVAEPPGSTAPRYRMLETVREFGQLELDAAGDADDARRAMFEWAVEFALDGVERTADHRQIEMLHGVALEQDNLVSILRAAIAGRDARVALGVFAVLAYSWSVRGNHDEVLSFIGDLLTASTGYTPEPRFNELAATAYITMSATALVAEHRQGLIALSRLRRIIRSGAELAPWQRGAAEFLLGLSDLDHAHASLERMTASDDLAEALLGGILTAQVAENEGEIDRAATAARRAFELSERSGEAWIGAMAAMTLAQLASQTARPSEALRWSEEAARRLRWFGAAPDLLQLEWIEAVALLSLGRLDEAEQRFERMTQGDRTGDIRFDLGAIGELGLSEAARTRGETANSVEHTHRALERYALPGRRASPWYVLSLAAFVAAGVDDDRDGNEIADTARRLRARTLAMHRVRPGYIDKPVLGTALVGWSSWAMTVPSLEDRALELLALAERLSPRQDLPLLALTARVEAAEQRLGAARVHEARSAAASVSPDAAVDRAVELLSERVP